MRRQKNQQANILVTHKYVLYQLKQLKDTAKTRGDFCVMALALLLPKTNRGKS